MKFLLFDDQLIKVDDIERIVKREFIDGEFFISVFMQLKHGEHFYTCYDEYFDSEEQRDIRFENICSLLNSN